ncbi:MAG TPA: chemotaxis protein CheW [Gemmatimonadales bacterium]|nr:chemotaxis protein CheW [Gemmatimonadales bacterium]
MTETPDGRHKATGLVVRVAAERWFVPLAGVVEVLRRPVVARVPASPPRVLGLVNHRGAVLTVIDPVRALELPGAGGSLDDVVVVEAGGRRFALGVEAVIELAQESRTGLATLDLERVAEAAFGRST